MQFSSLNLQLIVHFGDKRRRKRRSSMSPRINYHSKFLHRTPIQFSNILTTVRFVSLQSYSNDGFDVDQTTPKTASQISLVCPDSNSHLKTLKSDHAVPCIYTACTFARFTHLSGPDLMLEDAFNSLRIHLHPLVEIFGETDQVRLSTQ